MVLSVLTTSALLSSVGREHVVDCAPDVRCGDPSAYGDTFDWQHRTPLEFLDVLRQRAVLQTAHVTPAWYTVHGTHRGWIVEGDIPKLLELVDSTEPCAAVVSSGSSVLPTKLSTVGREAMFLIDGYRSGAYPPAIASIHWQGDSEEIRRWWQGRPDGRSGT